MSTETNKKKADKSDKIALYIQRTLCYIVLILLSILCLFSFYVLLINTTRSHPDIQKGFSLIPGKSFLVNMKNLLTDKQLPVLSGMANSLLVASGTAILSVYFSALTAYAIHAYNFRFKKLAFTFIMIIMMVPTQVSALGFIKQMSDMHLMNSFIPLVVPSIASPVVFFFIKKKRRNKIVIPRSNESEYRLYCNCRLHKWKHYLIKYSEFMCTINSCSFNKFNRKYTVHILLNKEKHYR